MENRIDDAWEAIADFEDSIGSIIEIFCEEFASLITVEYPNSNTITIKTPKDIAICLKCGELYDTAKGCCES